MAKMDPILVQLGVERLIPVLEIPDVEYANPVADALMEAGLQCVEVSLRTPAALDAISILADRGDVLVGASAVLNVSEARDAFDAGVAFVTSPGYSARIVAAGADARASVIPGISSATELMQAHERGLEAVMFFPAETAGGVAALQALEHPFPHMRIVASGGINLDNIADYLRLPQVLACVAPWLGDPQLYADGNFLNVTEAAADAMAIVREVEQSD